MVPSMTATFLDENLPDGTRLRPGTKFIKYWKMRNTGTMSWSSDTKVTLNYFPAVGCAHDLLDLFYISFMSVGVEVAVIVQQVYYHGYILFSSALIPASRAGPSP